PPTFRVRKGDAVADKNAARTPQARRTARKIRISEINDKLTGKPIALSNSKPLHNAPSNSGNAKRSAHRKPKQINAPNRIVSAPNKTSRNNANAGNKI